MSVLVVDVGTSSVRAALVAPDASVSHERARPALPSFPADGLVEFDPAELARAALELAHEVVEAGGPVEAVGISNQRASAVVWDRATGEPVGPGLGWQDLRTVGRCLELRAAGFPVAPNLSATKFEWLLDRYDPPRRRDLCVGTVDSWIAWTLSAGELHVTDATNAAVTGLQPPGAPGWDDRRLRLLRVPAASLPTIVDSTGPVGPASALRGAPPITAMTGDQQASLAGQGGMRRGDAKITFGTGGMLDLHLGSEPPPFEGRGPAGTFPIVAGRRAGRVAWGVEAVMLAAGTNVEWLRDGLGLLPDAAASHEVASGCTTAGGVLFVPAPLGLGTPRWDYGARGTFLGITRGTGRAELVRAVLEGIAQRGADLVEAAEADTGAAVPVLRVDGGMSDNPTFVQALADAAQRPVELSSVREATTRGAGLLAALGAGLVGSEEDLRRAPRARARIEPGPPTDRDRWREAVARAAAWVPELSGIDFS